MAEVDRTASLVCFDFEAGPLSDDTMVITCRRVWEENHPVEYVCHDHDGAFQFICSGSEHVSTAELVNIHAVHIFERGPEQLRDFGCLRVGCYAKHLDGEVWNLGQLPEKV